MSEDGSNGWKILSIGLIVTLVCSCFVLIGFLNFNGVSAEPNFIDVLIDGPKKLGVNENGTYTAYVESETSGNLDFTWSVSPQDNKTVLSFDGAVAKFKFVVATEEPYLLSVQVEDVTRKNFGSAAYTVYDPFTSSNLYLTGSDAVFSYMVESDNLGWYRVKSGDTGAVVGSPGTNLATVTSGILTSMTSGTLFLKEVSFDLALMNSIPQYVSVIESVNGLTRTFINPLDSQGAPYTISIVSANYLGQDKEGQILQSSTNAATVINNVFGYLTSGRTSKEVVNTIGNITITQPLIIPSYTKLNVQGAITLAYQSNCTMLQNSFGSWASDIEVTGGTWFGNGINQTRTLGASLYTGYYGNIFFFWGINSLSVHDIKFDNPNAWTVRIQNASQVNVNNINFNAPQLSYALTPNRDGIDINGPAHDVTISNLYGITGDDVVAITTGCVEAYQGGANYHGEVYDVAVNNIAVNDTGAGGFIKLFTPSTDYIHDISINGVTGVIGSGSSGFIYLDGNTQYIKGITVNNIKGESQQASNNVPAIWVGGSDWQLSNININFTSDGAGFNFTNPINVQLSNVILSNVYYSCMPYCFNLNSGTFASTTFSNVAIRMASGGTYQIPENINSNIDDGLKLYLPMDEATASTAYDWSGNTNNAVIASANVTTGKYSNALHFNGTTDYANITSPSSLEIPQWTFSMWIYRDADSGGYERLMQIQSVTGIGLGKYIQIDNNDKLAFGFWDSDGVNRYTSSSSAIATGQWYHIVGTFDGVRVFIYVDAVQKATEALAYTPDSTVGQPVNIGRLWYGGWNYGFHGVIDDVRIYNRALSYMEISNIYTNGPLPHSTS